MATRLEVYKCSLCGNIVEILNGADGELICCGQAMELLAEKAEDQGKEKHVPVIEKIDGGIKVTVGSIAHPMEEEHYIQWIELIADGRSCLKFLKPGDAPEATFSIEPCEVTAREHCSLHGLWKG